MEQSTTLVPHRTPDLRVLLQKAKTGAAALAVRAYLDAGGSADALSRLVQCRGPGGPRQILLLHHLALFNLHPHTELAECVRLLIEAGADINATSGHHQRTVLVHASECGCCTKPLQIFLQSGADALAASPVNGKTALHRAAAVGRIYSCEVLLAKESSLLHIRDTMGRTALMRAVTAECIDSTSTGVARANLDTVFGTKSMVFELKRGGVPAFFINAGADVNAVDRRGRSALMIAAQSNSDAIVKLLLEHGADIAATDSKGKNALYMAAQQGHVSMMRLLVEHGFDVKAAVDSAGDTVLKTAVYKGHKSAAEWLLQQGVATDAVNGKGATALHYAVSYCSDYTGMAELLLASGADVHIRCNYDRTPLEVAAVEGYIACAKVLIAAGADVLRVNSKMMTSLHIAVREGHSALVQLLLEHGATAVLNTVLHVRCLNKCECRCVGLTALTLCTTADTAKVLLAAGADVHAALTTGATCLHMAARRKLPVLFVCLLIKAGVDLHAVDNTGKTAAQIAHDSGNTLIGQILDRAAQQQEH
jgi:uncharacterized protein